MNTRRFPRSILTAALITFNCVMYVVVLPPMLLGLFA